jgi:hypothetical protein
MNQTSFNDYKGRDGDVRTGSRRKTKRKKREKKKKGPLTFSPIDLESPKGLRSPKLMTRKKHIRYAKIQRMSINSNALLRFFHVV